jgi:hypothetical protein
MKNTIDNLVKFATPNMDNEKLCRRFLDYWYDYNKVDGRYDKSFSLDEKEAELNKMIKEELIWRANLGPIADQPIDKWFHFPNVAPAAFSVVGSLIDMILPDSIIDTIGIYSDVRVGGWGDSAAFDIRPRDLFAVSKATLGKKVAEVKKQYTGQVTITPEFRAISVGVSLYRVLAGKESLADFTAKAIRSIETQMTVDVYNAMAAAMAQLPSTATTGLQIAGYSQANLVRLAEQVTAWNQGAKAMVLGTAVGLLNVLPDDANYRYTLDSEYVAVGHIPTMSGIDIMRLPQVADITTPFGRVLSDTNLWVISPASQKIIKVFLEGNTLSNTTNPFENADLSQTTTLWKSYGVAACTNAVAGLITL